MNDLTIQIEGGRTTLEPGSEIRGTVSWQLAQPAAKIELRLFWFTSGAGEEEVGVAETIPFEQPPQNDSRPFRLQVPTGPYSFTGQLISLNWALELVAKSCKEVGRVEIVIAPGGEPVQLERLPGVKPHRSLFALGPRYIAS